MAPNETAGLSTLLRYGYQPQRVAFWIYAQAIVLVWKGVRVHAPPHPSFRAGVEMGAQAQGEAEGVDSRGRRFAWRDARGFPWK